jgi:hypothetical protein
MQHVAPDPQEHCSCPWDWLLIAGVAIAVALLGLLPEVIPALIGRAGHVWTPFNSANHMGGDMYYYAPMVQQVLAGHIPPMPPNADPALEAGSPEAFRWLSYVIAALPGLASSDPRLPILWGYVLPPVAAFVGAALICRALTGRVWSSVVVGLLATFYYQFWHSLPPTLRSLSPSGIAEWWNRTERGFETRLARAASVYEGPLYSDMFRFLLPCMSLALLALFFFLLLRVDQERKVWLTAMAIPAACLMAFSYPPHALIAYFLLVMFAAVNVFSRDWEGLLHIMGVGVACLVFLVLARVPQQLTAGFSENTFISAVYSSEDAIKNDQVSWRSVISLVVSKYTLSLAAALALSWNDLRLRRAVIAVGCIAVLMSGAVLLPQLYSVRFLNRGIDHLWFIVMATVVAAWVVPRARQRWGSLSRHATATGVALAVALISLPAAGFSALLNHNLTDGRRFVPEGQWQAYQWLAKNAEGETVAALSWEDVEFIAVYMPKLRAIFSNADLSNQRPELAMAAFVGTWKDVGLTADKLRDWTQRSVEVEERRRRVFYKETASPFLSKDDYAASRIAQAVVYYPYITKFAGEEVADGEPKAKRASDAFVRNVLKIYADSPSGYIAAHGVRTLMLSPFEKALLAPEALANWQVEFETPERSIYRRVR